MGASDDAWRVLLDDVVKMRRVSSCGRRSLSCEVRSDIGADAGMGMERVGGRLSPGKDVRSTLIVRGAMVGRKWIL